MTMGRAVFRGRHYKALKDHSLQPSVIRSPQQAQEFGTPSEFAPTMYTVGENSLTPLASRQQRSPIKPLQSPRPSSMQRFESPG
jgi:hypothetical protein